MRYNNLIIQTLNNIMNIAYYTYFYGSDDNQAFSIPDIPSTKYPCFYFTNNRSMFNTLENTPWIGIFIDKPTTDDIIQSNMEGKHVKVLPHEYKELRDFDYTVMFDSKAGLINEGFVEGAIQTLFVNNTFAMTMREHWFYQNRKKDEYESIWNEYEVAMQCDRYKIQKDQYKSYIDEQLSRGFSHKTKDHCACGFIIRNMKHPKIKVIDYTWYSHVLQCGIEDQISFFFAKQPFMDYIYSFRDNPYLVKY